MKKLLSLFLIISCLGFGNVTIAKEEAEEYFIAPYGSSTASGTIDDPFDTLHTAIKNIDPNGKAVVINMRGGIYYMENPAVFGVEISGSADAPVTVRAYNGEEVIISGGRPVAGWRALENGMWRAYVPEYKFVRNLDVNGIGAVRAQSDAKLFHKGSFGADANFKDGIIIDKNDVPDGFSGENSELLFQYKWYEYHLKIDRCITDENNPENLKLYFKKPFNSTTFFVNKNSMTTDRGFTVINDYSLLDKEGEFYFDRDTGYLYYMPRENENIENAKAYIAKQEVLIKIEGENAGSKAGNIIFEGLKFANTTWKKGEYEGFSSRQSVVYYDMTNDIKAAVPSYQLIPAAIQVNMAENVVFKDNTFSNLGAVGLGFYDGVSGSVVEGNIFRDTGSSAITVGVEANQTEAVWGKTNIAYRKPARATNTYTRYHAMNVTDGTGGLWTSNSGKTSELVIDLEDEYTICNIELVPRGDMNYDKPTARMNFEILASNDSKFSEYTVLGSQGEEDFGIENTWNLNVENENKFRYIKYRKTDTYGSEISELKVYTKDLGGIPEKEVCKNNVIKNNLILRAGNDFLGSAGIHVFYSDNLEISNNHLTDLPYTGISLGWGWQRPNTTSRDNRIISNRIEHIMQRHDDGGGIYILGDQPDLLIENNVIRDVRYGAGGIYPDEGSSGEAENVILIKNNVVEDASYWLHEWSNTSEYITVENNYTTNPLGMSYGKNSSVSDTTLYIKDNAPSAVNEIIEQSGMTSEYTTLLDKVNGIPVLCGYETAEQYLNYGPHTANDAEINRNGQYYLKGNIMTARWYKEIIENNNLNVTGKTEYDEFISALEECEKAYEASLNSEGSTLSLANAKAELKNKTNALLNSGVFENLIEFSESVSTDLTDRLAP